MTDFLVRHIPLPVARPSSLSYTAEPAFWTDAVPILPVPGFPWHWVVLGAMFGLLYNEVKELRSRW